MVFIRMNKKQLIAMQCERSARIVSSKALIHVWKLSLVNQVGPSVVYAPPLYTSHNQIKLLQEWGMLLPLHVFNNLKLNLTLYLLFYTSCTLCT